MESLFPKGKLESYFHLLRLDDVHNKVIEKWRTDFLRSKIDPNTTKFNHRWNIYSSSFEHNYLLNLIREDISTYKLNTTSAHVIIVTNEEGIVLQIFGTESMLQRLEKMNLGIGTSLALSYTGINGVSLAMELKNPVMVKGDEHDLKLFAGWTCICVPIIVNNKIVAYINLSLHTNSDETFAIPFLMLLANRIQEKLRILLRNNILVSHSKICCHFDTYQLTSREKEIAFLWLRNKTYTEIASELYLSSETVRCYIKKIYQKTCSKNKADFITKFTILST